VVVFFLFLFSLSYLETKDTMYLYWGLPLSLLLLVIPLFSNYNLASQYARLLPEYEAEAQSCRIRQITLQMQGKPVRVEGVVQTVRGSLLARPSVVLYDGSGSITAKRSAPYDDTVRTGDTVEVVGLVMKKFTAVGELTVHAIGLRKIDGLTQEDKPAEKVRVKKYQ
jgi:hypothetical protein